MGAIWLLNLPDWLADAGLDVDVWPGWETRSRGSGGYDSILGIGVHHDAWPASASLEQRCRYAWDTAQHRPIGAIWLHSDGKVMVGAAGATNTQGKGGPYVTSKGTIPLNDGNRHIVPIEASNDGVGQVWPDVQLDAYRLLCATLCEHLDLDPLLDIIGHMEWAPDRKIDPAGPPYAIPGDRYGRWDMDRFRADTLAVLNPPPQENDDMGMNVTKIRFRGFAEQIVGFRMSADTLRTAGVLDEPVVVLEPPTAEQQAEIERQLGAPLTPTPNGE